MGLRVFVTDCEGPVSKNDNAFELTSRFIPMGDRFFTLVSRYDDVLADIVKKPKYKAGDTLKLILPFLKAYGATNEKMRVCSSENILFVPGADETLRFVRSIMPSYIVSTSYEHYVSALCNAVGFPIQNAYCTRADLDKYAINKKESQRLKVLREEISKMQMIEIPVGARVWADLSAECQRAVRRLDDVFWGELSVMDVGRMLREVNPIGGYEKANAVKEIAEKTGAGISDIMYVGDSITDIDPFRLVKEQEGLTVSFNGNQYAIREADIAVMSHHTAVISILAETFGRLGTEQAIELAEDWSEASLQELLSTSLLGQIEALPPGKAPRVERITPENRAKLAEESSMFRKTVRGEAIGRLG